MFCCSSSLSLEERARSCVRGLGARGQLAGARGRAERQWRAVEGTSGRRPAAEDAPDGGRMATAENMSTREQASGKGVGSKGTLSPRGPPWLVENSSP